MKIVKLGSGWLVVEESRQSFFTSYQEAAKYYEANNQEDGGAIDNNE
jgi:hypothetical protein